MTPRDLRLFLLLRAVVTRELKRVDDRHRQELLADSSDDPDAAMTPGERRAVHVRGPDGERVKVGDIRVDAAPTTAKVANEAAFLAWVREHHPSEIVEAVRPAFARRVLDQVRQDGGWVDQATGELVDVPGVVVETGEPRVVVTSIRGAAEVLAEAHRRGALPQLTEFMRAIGPGREDPET